MIRNTIVAGRFYPETEKECKEQILEFHKKIIKSNRKKIIAGIVPHAGWIFSGQTAYNVLEAETNSNACGSGAIASTVAAAKTQGIKKGELINYTTSSDVMPEYGNSSFVGYAGIVF